MYEKHFGLTRRPFASTADTPAYYPSATHERAFQQVTTAIRQEDGFALLMGEIGTGKTLLAHRLLHHFHSEMQALWITNTRLPDAAAFFQTLLYELGQPCYSRPEHDLRLQVTDQLLTLHGEGRSALFVIDDAHLLPASLLEELRLLGNLQTRQGRTFQAVLVGQPALLDMLREPELASLSQQIIVRAMLTPMDVHEAVDYLLHHVRAAGGRPELITDEALELLARGARGVPRILNQAATKALEIASVAEQTQVDAEAAIEALSELGFGTEEPASLSLTLPSPNLEEERLGAAATANGTIAPEIISLQKPDETRRSTKKRNRRVPPKRSA